MKALLTGIIAISFLSAYSQVNFERYFDQNSLPLVNSKGYLGLTFKWDMKGMIQANMNEGINNLAEKNPEIAIGNFTEVIKLDSSFWPGYYYRGVSYKNLNKWSEALADLIKAQMKEPASAEVHFEKGEIFHLQNDLEKATNEYNQAIALNPKLVQCYHNLGSIALVKGEFNRARKYYDKCNELDPTFADAYMMEGVILLKVRKNDNNAIKYFDKAIQANTSFSQAYLWRGLTYLNVNKFEPCLSDWNRLAQLNPASPFPLLLRGYLNIEMTQYDQAFIDFKKVYQMQESKENKFIGGQTILDRQIDLDFAIRYLIRNGYGLNEVSFSELKKGFCLLLAGKKDLALESINGAQKAEVSAPVFFLKALVFEHKARHDSAYVYYSKALELDNDIFDAHKKRSIYRYELKNWKGALADFDQMLKLQPETMVTYRLRGLIKINIKDYYGAIMDFTKFLKYDSLDAEIWKQRGIARTAVEDKTGGNRDFLKCVTIQPNGNLQLYEIVTEQYLLLHDTTEALKTLKIYSSSNPMLPYPYLKYGEIYVQMKKWALAKQKLDSANRVLPLLYALHANLYYLKGICDFNTNQYESSIINFNKSLEISPESNKCRYYRGKAYLQKGDTKKALKDFEILRDRKYEDSENIVQNIIKIR